MSFDRGDLFEVVYAIASSPAGHMSVRETLDWINEHEFEHTNTEMMIEAFVEEFRDDR